MENNYLRIRTDWLVSYCDDAFFGFTHVKNREEFINFCNEKANKWRNSNLCDFDKFTKEQREKMASLWEFAKQLSVGKYEYYFNYIK